MPDPMVELNSRIAELRTNLAFVALAAKLRPRIGEAVEWGARSEVLKLVHEFMESKSIRAEGVYIALLIALMASFERYIRMLVTQAVEKHAAGASLYDDIPSALATRNIVLTGRVLASIESPRDYITLDVQSMISNLASCKRGNKAFSLNPRAFSAAITGVAPSVLEEALKTVGVTEWWDGVGASLTLANLLGTKRARETGDRAREKLKELCKWRNHLAHGGDEEVTLTDTQIREAIDFIAGLASALSETMGRRLSNSTK